MIYRANVNAHVTIFRDEYISVAANSQEEANEMFYAAFKQIMEEKYGWADFDDVNIENMEVEK